MRRCSCSVCLLAVAPLAAVALPTSAARAQNILVNGSFEQGTFGSPAGGFISVAPGSTAITGWSVFSDQIAWITTPNITPITASDGLKFLDLQDPGATPAPYGGVTQTITTTVGQRYRLIFSIGVFEDNAFDPNLGGPITVRASAGAVSADYMLSRPTNSGLTWATCTLDFTAASASTVISLLGLSGENFIGVDGASVIAVPTVTWVQWSSAVGGNNHWYAAVSVPAGLNWLTAHQSAQALGGHLVTLTSAAENAFAFSLVDAPQFWFPGGGHNHGPWLGGFQPAGSPEPAGNWQWVTGETWAYTHWDPTDPNNVGNQNRLIFYADNPGRSSNWDDLNETELPIRGYIVESTGAPTACNLADIAAVGGTAETPGVPDGQLTVDDIIVFVNLFSDETGCPGAPADACSRADVTGVGGPPVPPDGQLTVDDIIAFVNTFSDGC